jgi:hypothetical protein
MPDYFGREFEYMQDYMRRFYPGRLLSPTSEKVFGRWEQMIKQREAERTEGALENIAGRGVLGSDINQRVLQRMVIEPTAREYAAKDTAVLELEEAERLRREGIARDRALARISEEEARKQRRSGLVGRVLGGSITGLITGGPTGAILGAIGAGYAKQGEPGTSGIPGYNQMVKQYYDKLNALTANGGDMNAVLKNLQTLIDSGMVTQADIEKLFSV